MHDTQGVFDDFFLLWKPVMNYFHIEISSLYILVALVCSFAPNVYFLQKPTIMGNSLTIWLTGNSQQISNQLAYLYLGIVTLGDISKTPDTEVV
jgi:hypothetical protein